uniref:Uncharacterized protein n=1 Tax=Ananas comosus var. bracteatus TaxID=296719 RepID=A0A6V7PSU1_ANACO|nr:unnamed protein product [Ananas comosus var. bracteatus]
MRTAAPTPPHTVVRTIPHADPILFNHVRPFLESVLSLCPDGRRIEYPHGMGPHAPPSAWDAEGGGEANYGVRGPEVPAAPRKRRSNVACPPPAPPRPRKEFYAGPDLDAFFAAHNL